MSETAISLFLVPLALLLGWIAYMDLRHGVIRNVQNGLLLALGLTYQTFMAEGASVALVGAIIAGSVFYVIHLGFLRFRGRNGLGLGDVKFMAAAGSWVGWAGLAPIMVLSSAAGLLAFSVWRPADGRLPFGPWLALGLFSTILLRAAGIESWPRL